jgi:hypothetical protein
MQQDVCCLIEGGSHHRVTAPANVAIVVSLARVVAPGCKAEGRSDIS